MFAEKFTRSAIRLSAFLLSCLFLSIPQIAYGQAAPNSSSNPRKKVAKTPPELPPDKVYEDFASLGISSSQLEIVATEVLEKDEEPDKNYIQEHVRLTWRALDSVDLYIGLPKGVKKPPVVLYLYSYPEPAYRFLSPESHWTADTTAGGYACVGFISALTADRMPPGRTADETFITDLQESLVTTVHDVQMILNYLSSRGDLDTDRVGMFGVGSGGSIAILASAVDPRIKAIDVFNPWGDWPDWLAKTSSVPDDERASLLAPEFLKKIAPFDPMRWLPKVKAQRVRFQSIRSETKVPAEVQKKMEAAAPAIVELNQFGDYAAFSATEPASSVFKWLQVVLQPDTAYKREPDKSKRVHFYPAMGKKFEPAPGLNP